MKYGAMNNPMSDTYDEIRLFGDLGFDFIDLTVEPQQTYSGTLDTKRIIRALEKAEMGVVGHTAWYLPIASAFPDLRATALNELKRCMHVLKDVGATKMNVHPYLKVPLHEDDWIVAHNVEAIAQLAELGNQLDMLVLVENMPGFSRVSHMQGILEAVPEALLLLDVGHANLDTPYNRSDELLANFGDRLGHVHVSDNRGGHDDMHLPLGVGNINWMRIVHALKNAGYDETLTLEVFSDDNDYLAISRDKIRNLWESTPAGETITVKPPAAA